MKTMVFLLCFASGLTALAADPPSQYNATMFKAMPLTEAERQKNFIESRPDRPVIAIGKSDFVLSGPLVEGFRRLPQNPDLSRGQKFLRLPIIRLLVPGPMENPPGTGKYFVWRNDQCAVPWTAAASRPPIEKGP
jgi:hypothetical protein